MQKFLYCVDRFSKEPVFLPVSVICATKLQDVYRTNCPLIIFEDKFLKKRESLDFSKLSGKICLVYFSDNDKNNLNIIKKFNFFDYFINGESKESICFKIKRAEKFAQFISRNNSLEKDLLDKTKKIEQILLIDPVTGCYNWRYFFDRTAQEFSRAYRHLYDISFVGINIDNFRRINEVYSVDAGDFIIKEFVKFLKSNIRQEDILIRWRGDEFFIIFPNMSQLDAYKSLKRIANRTTSKKFKYKNLRISLNVRIAIVSFPQDNVSSPRDVVNSLEECLDIARKKGRESIVCYPYCKDAIVLGEKEDSDIEGLKEKITKLSDLLTQDVLDMIYGFAKAIEAKDFSTAKHVESTALIAEEIAKELKLPKSEIDKVKHAAILHDLGKVGIDESILTKKGPLNRKERKIVNTHPLIATEILRGIQALRGAIPAILYHHERWDGKGYPTGLKGDDIPLNARIIAVADVYQALISNRSYRKAYSKQEAMAIIQEGRDTHFDPQIVKIFLQVIDRIKY